MDARKKIAFVANTSWGIYKFRLYIIRQLLAAGYEVLVIAPRDKYTTAFEQLQGLVYQESSMFKGKSLSPLGDIHLYKELRYFYRLHKPHLIFHYTIKANIYGTIAAAREKIPSVAVITGLGYAFMTNNVLAWGAKQLYRYSLRKSSRVWFLNEDDRQLFLKQKLVEEQRTFLLPGEGVDTNRFHAAPYEERSPISFLMIARLIRHKGIMEYMEAARILKSKGLAVQFTLIGFFEEDSPISISKAAINKYVDDGIVNYPGEKDDVKPYIQDADCVVLPSYREGLPLSLLEAASMAKCLITTDTAGCHDVVHDGVNGFLCVAKNTSSLAQAMEKFCMLSADEKKQMGLAGRNMVMTQFSNNIITAKYQQAITDLLH